MRAEDLMVGDWVQNETGDIVGKVVSVDSIRHCVVFYDNGGVLHSLDEVYPITLTEDILKKSGFKNSEWYGWQIKEPDFTLCFVGDTPHFLLDDIFVCDCPYVHTLQHALKLCEIKKEIVL